MAGLRITSLPIDEPAEEFLPYYLGKTEKEAERIYYEFASLLETMARSYSTLSGIPKGDLFGEALVGLARARRDFDPYRSSNFRTFAIYKIKNALNEYYRKNKGIVSIPSYVRTAHMHIMNIETVLGKYNFTAAAIEEILHKGELKEAACETLHGADLRSCVEEIRKLKVLAKNSNLTYLNLVKRSRYVPSSTSLDESLSQEEIFLREEEMMAAALLVSQLKDSMNPTELAIAEGIMAGKSYAEIGRSQNPKRSIAWVQARLNLMRQKFVNLNDKR